MSPLVQVSVYKVKISRIQVRKSLCKNLRFLKEF